MYLVFVVPKLVVAFLLINIGGASISQHVGSDSSTFKAAVYEHIPFLPLPKISPYTRPQALELMMKNLQVYETQTQEARKQGAQILVFPEDGIYGMVLKTKEAIFPFMEKIPDPKVTKWSPCTDPTRYPNSEVQHALSCMAKVNGLYVVANMGDIVPCNHTHNPKCPPSGHFQYNTDVAFDPKGTLVAKYHKTHLFYETQFDTPEPEVVYFDTPFGRFGMLVCFDLLFKDPAVTMVTEHSVQNIVFPTAWMDALPLLSAVGFHSSFARGLGINFLSANIHLPISRFHGSGIFTPDGVASYYYDSDLISPGKLLVSTLNVLKTNSTEIVHSHIKATPDKIKNDFNSTGDEFQSELFNDKFTFKLLEESYGSLNVCQKNVCCSLTYQISNESNSRQELFAFGAFDGLHTYQGQYYFQICTLVKCENNIDKRSCGTATKDSKTKFKSLSMTGRFQTKFVYPQIVMSKDGQLKLGDKQSWDIHNTTLTALRNGLEQPLITAALYGRYYCRDDGLSDCR